jgi:hypothetical protein
VDIQQRTAIKATFAESTTRKVDDSDVLPAAIDIVVAALAEPGPTSLVVFVSDVIPVPALAGCSAVRFRADVAA